MNLFAEEAFPQPLIQTVKCGPPLRLAIGYPLVFFDAIRVKIRDEGVVRNKAIHIALGVMADGTKVVLGMWIEQNEGAKFWLRVMNELKNRGVEDILLAVVDGLKGFPEAITAVFPETIVQTCLNPIRFKNLRNADIAHAHKHRAQSASAQQCRSDSAYQAYVFLLRLHLSGVAYRKENAQDLLLAGPLNIRNEASTTYRFRNICKRFLNGGLALGIERYAVAGRAA